MHLFLFFKIIKHSTRWRGAIRNAFIKLNAYMVVGEHDPWI